MNYQAISLNNDLADLASSSSRRGKRAGGSKNGPGAVTNRGKSIPSTSTFEKLQQPMLRVQYQKHQHPRQMIINNQSGVAQPGSIHELAALQQQSSQNTQRSNNSNSRRTGEGGSRRQRAAQQKKASLGAAGSATGEIDLGHPQIFSYEMSVQGSNTGVRKRAAGGRTTSDQYPRMPLHQKHMMKSGKGMIVQHKIPTAAIGGATHGSSFGFDPRGDSNSLASSNDPITLRGLMQNNSPKMSRLHQRTQEVAYYQGMPVGGVEDETMRESRLTNIVLDDFVKQVSNLEQQVDRQSSSALEKHTINQPVLQNEPQEKATTSTPMDNPLQHHDSTDLDESRPIISMMQSKGGIRVTGSPRKPDSTVGSVRDHQVIVRNIKSTTDDGNVENFFLKDVVATSTKRQPDDQSDSNQNQQPTITNDQIEEMKRRVQRRQKGIMSEENSYLTKLDPAAIVSDPSLIQWRGGKVNQQGQLLPNDQMHHFGTVPGRFMHSVGNVRTNNNQKRDRIDHPNPQLPRGGPAGQNQFVKSFVQNQKNSSLFNTFLGRCSLNNQPIAVQKQGSQHGPTAQKLEAILEQARNQAKALPQTESSTKSNHDIKIKSETAGDASPSIDEVAKHSTLHLRDGDINPFLQAKPTLPLTGPKDGWSVENSDLATDRDNANFTPAYNNATPARQGGRGSGINVVTQRRESVETSTADAQSIQVVKAVEMDAHKQQEEPQVTSFNASRAGTTKNIQQYPATQPDEKTQPIQSRIVVEKQDSTVVARSDMVSPQFSVADRGQSTLHNSLQAESLINSPPKTRRIVPVPIPTAPCDNENQAVPATTEREALTTVPAIDTSKAVATSQANQIKRSLKNQTLASLVSADQLEGVTSNSRRFQQQKNIKNTQNVNVEIKLMNASGQNTFQNRGKGAEDSSLRQDYVDDENIQSSRMAPSESQQVMHNIISRFHKYDIKFHLAKNSEDRSKYKPMILAEKDRKHRSVIASSVGKMKSMQINQGQYPHDQMRLCTCNGLACCTLRPRSLVQDCVCVVHSYKNTVFSKNEFYNGAGAAADNSDSLSVKAVYSQAPPDSRQTLLPQKRITQPYHRTVDKWSTNYNKPSSVSRGNKTAIHSSRDAKQQSLTQILAKGQTKSHSRQRFTNLKEQKITEGKLPAVIVDPTNFASAQHIEGARVTFIEQLKRNSLQQDRSIDGKDSQSAIYQQLIGQHEHAAENFQQIITDARKSAEVTQNEEGLFNTSNKSPQHRKQGILSPMANALSQQQDGERKVISQTQNLLADQKTNPTLSVKKQLRLQKMALQGMDYRPGKNAEKIFDQSDIKELFKSSYEQHEITQQRFNVNQSLTQGSQDSMMMREGEFNHLMSEQNLSNHGYNSAQGGGPGYDDYDANRIAAAAHHNNRHIRTGGVSFRHDMAFPEPMNEMTEPSSPMSEYMRNLNLQYSKQTEDWLRQAEQKKLAYRQKQIKQLTADPVKSIELTKAKNNQAMIRKIQSKVQSLNSRRNDWQAIAHQYGSMQAINSIQETALQEDSFFSMQNPRNMSDTQKQVFNSTNLSLEQNSIQKIIANQTTLKDNRMTYQLDEEHLVNKLKQINNKEDHYANSMAADSFEKSSLFRPTQATNPHQRSLGNNKAIGNSSQNQSQAAYQMAQSQNRSSNRAQQPFMKNSTTDGAVEVVSGVRLSDGSLAEADHILKPIKDLTSPTATRYKNKISIEQRVPTNIPKPVTSDRQIEASVDGTTLTLTMINSGNNLYMQDGLTMPPPYGHVIQNLSQPQSAEVIERKENREINDYKQNQQLAPPNPSSPYSTVNNTGPQQKPSSPAAKKPNTSRHGSSQNHDRQSAAAYKHQQDRMLQHSNEEWSQLIGKNIPAPDTTSSQAEEQSQK